MPDSKPLVRQDLVEKVYETKQQLIKQTAEAIGPPAGSQELTAEEIARGWQFKDFRADPEQVWIEELQRVATAFPHMTLAEAMDEARPHVGLRLYPYRDDLASGAGRGDLAEQARWAKTMAEKVSAGPAETATKQPAAAEEEPSYGPE